MNKDVHRQPNGPSTDQESSFRDRHYNNNNSNYTNNNFQSDYSVSGQNSNNSNTATSGVHTQISSQSNFTDKSSPLNQKMQQPDSSQNYTFDYKPVVNWMG